MTGATRWDPYSPVAMWLWRGADFAELGDDAPMVSALYERVVPSGGYHLSREYKTWAEACSVTQRGTHIAHVPHVAWAVFLRQLAEFGPAGRPQ